MIRHRFRRFDGKTMNVERDVWLCALDLALRGGWKPRGVEVADDWDGRVSALAYFPARGQRVSEPDAYEIGEALEVALTFVSDRGHRAREVKLTRVEIHFQDLNAHKGGIDKRCLIEARPRGLNPVAADHESERVGDAFRGALVKLQRVLEHRIGRLDSKGHGR